MKKGYLFTLDALIAFLVLVGGIVFISTTNYSHQLPTEQIQYYSEDIISILSEIKIYELAENPVVARMINDSNITYLNKTLVEQIGLLWVKNRTALASELAMNVTSSLIGDRYGYEIFIFSNISNQTIFQDPKGSFKDLVTHHALISGIEERKPVEGTTARIYLTSIKVNMKSD